MQTIKNKKDSMLESIKNREGFTLIELIVVMAIIAILVLLAAPRFLGYTKDAEATAVQQDVKVLSDAAFQYNIENEGAWPVADGSVALEDADGAVVAVAQDADAAAEVHALDADALGAYVKSTKNDIGAYGLITTGKDEGSVVHLEGVEDKNNVRVFGLGDEFEVAPVTP